MEIVNSIAELRRARAKLIGDVGLVPTMGYLHAGHLSLVKKARMENPNVIATIFVNPAQFGPSEDFSSYPRSLERDLELLDREGTDLVFAPPTEEIYPPGFSTYVDVGGPLIERLEGHSRPGHFRGVATVVTKLFSIVQPTRAYFGQKDAQQVLVVKRLVADLNLPLEIVVIPIVREPDGLAMSSRNAYLNPAERQAATVLSRALRAAQTLHGQGERDADRIRGMMIALIDAEPLARIDYVSVADPIDLRELDTVAGQALALLAVRIGRTRLIDNAFLGDAALV